MINTADLGPEGGDKGGEIVTLGTSKKVATCARSYTARYLEPVLEAKTLAAAVAAPAKAKPGRKAKLAIGDHWLFDVHK